jgi:hypothetical protein
MHTRQGGRPRQRLKLGRGAKIGHGGKRGRGTYPASHLSMGGIVKTARTLVTTVSSRASAWFPSHWVVRTTPDETVVGMV